jgi:hypothetical protein
VVLKNICLPAKKKEMLYKSIILSCSIMLCINVTVSARIWRINNTPGIAADFATLSACITNASVLNDDTVYIEGSAVEYPAPTIINKRLVFISTGYFISGAGANIGLQANPNPATISGALVFDSLASGSRFLGINSITDLWLDPRADNIRFERCRFSSISWRVTAPTTANIASNIVFNKCFFTGVSLTNNFYLENLQVTNCIINSFIFLPSNLIGIALIRNNIFQGSITLTNSYFANNLVLNTGPAGFTVTASTIRNNIANNANVLPAGAGNQNGISNASLFVGPTGNSTDGQWQLAASSPAIGAGETVGGITPNCGPFGTADPYRLSGIPPVPTIYSLTVPATVPIGQPLNITVSTRSNN